MSLYERYRLALEVLGDEYVSKVFDPDLQEFLNLLDFKSKPNSGLLATDKTTLDFVATLSEEQVKMFKNAAYHYLRVSLFSFISCGYEENENFKLVVTYDELMEPLFGEIGEYFPLHWLPNGHEGWLGSHSRVLPLNNDIILERE